MTRLIDPEDTERSRRFHEKRRERLWWVGFDSLLYSLLVDQEESTAWERTFYCDRIPYRKRKTDVEGVSRLEPTVEREFVVVEECDMKLAMRALRKNGVTGRYRRAGTDKEYRF